MHTCVYVHVCVSLLDEEKGHERHLGSWKSSKQIRPWYVRLTEIP